jgi:hypothetical protein
MDDDVRALLETWPKSAIGRIADALERIAAAFERSNAMATTIDDEPAPADLRAAWLDDDEAKP